MSTTLEAAVHRRWAESPELVALAPAERVRTGTAHGGPLPYATIAREKRKTLVRTSGNTVDEVTLRIDLWHDRHDAGRAAADAVRAAFDRAKFDLDATSRVVRMCPIEESSAEHADGPWQFTLVFSIHLHLTHGA